MNKQIEEAIKILNQGGIVIFPTDTAFGIGCRIDNESAIKKLFKIRKRPDFMASPVLVDGREMVKDYVSEIPKDVEEKLINRFWPGALTIVLLTRIAKVPELVRGYGTTVGFRMPDNQTIQEVIKNVGVPILGSSANFHGEKTPFELKELDNELIKLVDYVINGECRLKKPSTVIDCSVTPWKILRQGALKVNI